MRQPYAEEIILVLRKYVQLAIPAYVAGEMNFWASTVPLEKRPPDLIVLARISINWQEVMNAILYRGKPGFSFCVAKSAIQQGSRLRQLGFTFRLRRRGGWATGHQYRPGGQDQVYLEFNSLAGTRAMLSDAVMQQAIRVFNMRLSRRGPTAFSKFHCFDLADRLVGE